MCLSLPPWPTSPEAQCHPHSRCSVRAEAAQPGSGVHCGHLGSPKPISSYSTSGSNRLGGGQEDATISHCTSPFLPYTQGGAERCSKTWTPQEKRPLSATVPARSAELRFIPGRLLQPWASPKSLHISTSQASSPGRGLGILTLSVAAILSSPLYPNLPLTVLPVSRTGTTLPATQAGDTVSPVTR